MKAVDARPASQEAVPPLDLPPLVFVDTHCHLDLHQFDDDRAAVIERALAAGVARIINPAIDVASCRRVLALAEQHESVYAAVGVHPNDCGDFDDAALADLGMLAQHPKVVAIGEIGLDYYWEKTPHDLQQRVLAAQLELAADLGLPVILHSRNRTADARDCTADLLWIMAQLGPAIRTQGGETGIIGVWHAFSGDMAEAQHARGLGLALGIGGPVTFQNARRLHELAPQLPRDRLLLETDAPYLAPHPHRGQRNEPAYVPLVARKLAQLYNESVGAVAAQTTANARVCFPKLDICLR